MTPPDSGEREVCGFVTATGASICTLPPWHTEWHKVEPNHSPRDSGERDPREPTCACGLCFPGVVVIHETERCGPGVGVPLSLAQRILAALENAGVYDGLSECRALAAELRACVEGKA